MSNAQVNNVEQIRDILFGSQIKDFEEKFVKIENLVSTIEKSMKKALNEAHTKLQKETERALEVLEKKIDNLSSSTQKERAKLKDLIDTTDETFQIQLNNQKDEFATKLKILKDNVSDEQQKLLENINNIKIDVENMLNNKLNKISDDKLSRDSMAQMLLEIAMKIKGTDINQILNIEDKKTAKQ
jgi:vacuolar-type H+-ATPase subunit E/Vma4